LKCYLVRKEPFPMEKQTGEFKDNHSKLLSHAHLSPTPFSASRVSVEERRARKCAQTPMAHSQSLSCVGDGGVDCWSLV
jgi:hypothetical protein